MRASILGLVLLGACADTEGTFGDVSLPGDGGGPAETLFGDLAPLPDGVTPYDGDPVVYAHSASQLYKLDPTSLSVTLIGAFKWPSGSDQMTDIALDRKGKMTGISFNSVYSVDPKTAACTYLAPLQTPSGIASFNGLSYIAVQAADTTEALMASAGDGTLYEIDPATGQSKKVGAFGGGLGSSGDLVSVKGLTLATVKQGFGLTDWLARVNPLTGQAVLIGDTGFSDVWGLGFWKDKVYGFTEGGQLIVIDPKTGKGTQASSSSAAWWGAGVTTSAPVIE
jgi:hypothetical protein